MSILQLNPSIPVETPKGAGQAILVIDYSCEHDLIWTVIIDSTNEIWSFKNKYIRGQKNVTMERQSNLHITKKYETSVIKLDNY